MICCLCGYSCGTKAAFERHILKFADDAASIGLHGETTESTPRPPVADIVTTDSAASLTTSSSTSPRRGISDLSLATTPVTPAATLVSCTTPAASDSTPVTRQASSGSVCWGPADSLSSQTSQTACSGEDGQVRLLLVRHAQSANKERRPGDYAEKDPGLTELGHSQAEALGQRLMRECRPQICRPGTFLIVSSPMARCLLTIQPAIHKLEMTRDILCHAGLYEFGCAGTSFLGTSWNEIHAEFPEFSPACFTDCGLWDYLGSSEKESEDECRLRANRVVTWLFSEAVPMVRARPPGKALPTILLATHQTFADLLCQVLVNGNGDAWKYGNITFRMSNASISEFILQPDGRVEMGSQNDGTHLTRLRN